ncbi:phosphatidylinositol N-acetylglucosaminyltransferase subunit P [Coccinella septempunctata]|uniref:phosphatidylinositol N-acetylglucosaminyltransferase subunit P n=1 Tax=Coccinella septempunctata TaxID=41139 RepID=UPI001D076FDB|nr:phosphatidylinositol N-acetylglucosaminyltransferase subunit P [Coccinella septempunctata]
MPEHTPAPTPSRAVYGFAMYFSFRLFFCLYLVWAVVPEHYFRSLGITCLPHRYWAVSPPIFLLTVFAVFIMVIYPSLGLCMTPDVDDLRTIKDKVGSKKNIKASKILSPKIYGKKSSECCLNLETCYKKTYENEECDLNPSSIPVLKDLKIWEVSKKLYINESI